MVKSTCIGNRRAGLRNFEEKGGRKCYGALERCWYGGVAILARARSRLKNLELIDLASADKSFQARQISDKTENKKNGTYH